jgi:hypothetical protein
MANTEEEYFSAPEDDDTPIFIIHEKIIDRKDDNTFFIKLTFRELLAYTGYWCYNRTICSEKVAELYTSLCECYNIPFILHAIYDEKHNDPVRKLLILDGQHRREAIKQYIETNDKSWDCPHCVWICVYKYNNAETHQTAPVLDLFKKINNNRIFNMSELPDTFIIDLVKEICEIPHFKKQKAIGTNVQTNSCHSPCIHKKELNTLFTNNKEEIKATNLTLTQLVENVQKINHRLSMKSFDELYVPCQRNTEKVRYQKAVSKGFFLNLKNSKYTPDVWVKFVNEPNRL